MNPIYELNITWEVTWTPDDSDEERKEYTGTTEYFYEDDDLNSVDDFFKKPMRCLEIIVLNQKLV